MVGVGVPRQLRLVPALLVCRRHPSIRVGHVRKRRARCVDIDAHGQQLDVRRDSIEMHDDDLVIAVPRPVGVVALVLDHAALPAQVAVVHAATDIRNPVTVEVAQHKQGGVEVA
eukprot:COSAG05_NODE_3561_length_1990_cov_1.299841_2_plen_114_part_00